jgi:hypothetical protein
MSAPIMFDDNTGKKAPFEFQSSHRECFRMLRNSRITARQRDPICKFGHEPRWHAYCRTADRRGRDRDPDEAGQLARLFLTNSDKIEITELLPQ